MIDALLAADHVLCYSSAALYSHLITYVTPLLSSAAVLLRYFSAVLCGPLLTSDHSPPCSSAPLLTFSNKLCTRFDVTRNDIENEQ